MEVALGAETRAASDGRLVGGVGGTGDPGAAWRSVWAQTRVCLAGRLIAPVPPAVSSLPGCQRADAALRDDDRAGGWRVSAGSDSIRSQPWHTTKPLCYTYIYVACHLV